MNENVKFPAALLLLKCWFVWLGFTYSVLICSLLTIHVFRCKQEGKVLHYCRSVSTNYSAHARWNQGSKHTILFPQHLWPYLFQTSQLKQLLWKTFQWYHFVFLCCKWWLPACQLWMHLYHIALNHLWSKKTTYTVYTVYYSKTNVIFVLVFYT